MGVVFTHPTPLQCIEAAYVDVESRKELKPLLYDAGIKC